MVSPLPPPVPTPPSGNMSAPNHDERTSNLLNLLKFSGAGAHSSHVTQPRQGPYQQQQHQEAQPQHHQPEHQHQAAQQHQSGHNEQSNEPPIATSSSFPAQILAPAPTSQDPTGLLRALMSGAHENDESRQDSPNVAANVPLPASSFAASSPSEDTRAYLLNLLNRPKPSQHDQPLLTEAQPQPHQHQHHPHHRGSLEHSPGTYPDATRPYHQVLEDAPNGYATAQPPPQNSHDYEKGPYEEAPPVPFYGPYAYPPNNHEADMAASRLYGNTYGNAYEEPHVSSTRDHTPKSGSVTIVPQSSAHSAGHSPAGPPYQILKKSHDSPVASHHGSDRRSIGDGRSPLTSPEHLRSKGSHSWVSPHHTPGSVASLSVPSEERHRETVSEAVHEIADRVSQEAQEAVARSEEEVPHAQPEAQPETQPDESQTQAESQAGFQPEYMHKLEDMSAARTEKELEESTREAAQAIKKELDREENSGVLEETVPPAVAQEVRDIVEEAAAQAAVASSDPAEHAEPAEPADAADAADTAEAPAEAVADSWESADQDEIVVIEEETPPVKVFNFPKKPWISITVKDDGSYERPLFREESIMDIARLKKEFDQIDRNLYTATENYMVYGMSKAGGLRVIRQEDGRDAKVFTDTKDRIFNVAMSVTPHDHAGPHREAILGTGISGTVYWLQIRHGEKDHIEDTHPEQHGFALPPLQEGGDAPGGVLKTRARPSTMHPEFFAVGRGKSINIIWPSYIMQNNLIKPGHDRLVDADALAKQCSLKINTGKAGKDFTFSQDDSVVVSLDKSGRVKFWDVRDLTAVKEGCDPQAPVPAHTSLEVKEPLLTLTSTPEGEKAWPTSVLLVDKLRPYQKRCALRYMIVGMKQNHTLQLWDLALGKPVQEFNLPHSKESDAVCSVMYHPQTGMIVIGHPTRNSIYFAHLSAPKYNLKSVSQVEYIQRLVAQDASIPQPDSTAVISGVREYSFANRGILRSLDLLSAPAMSQDSDEPTLFELYGMHSKGVACLLIKQTELGWSKDNKVLAPVDAVDAGVISISKLKAPAVQPAEQAHPDAATSQTPHIAARSSNRESERTAGPEASTPVKSKQETSAEEPVAPTPIKEEKSEKPERQEKPERKGRKKKAASAAAAALAAESQSNGAGGPSPRSGAKDSKSVASAAQSNISQESIEAVLGTMESRLNSSFAGTINAGLKNLYTKIEDGHREREKDFDQRQLKLLDMVSEVLNENTQKVLESLIQDQFTHSVIPAISDVARKAVADQFSSSMADEINHSIQKEIHRALPNATQHALQKPKFVEAISDRVGSSVAESVEREVLDTLTDRLSSSFSHVAATACQRVADEMQRQHRTELEAVNAQRAADAKKIDQLSAVVTQLTSMVSGMAASQEQFQGEFIRFQRQMLEAQAQAQSQVQAPHALQPQPQQQPQPRHHQPHQPHQPQHHQHPTRHQQQVSPTAPTEAHDQAHSHMQHQLQQMQQHVQTVQKQGGHGYGVTHSPQSSHRSMAYPQSHAHSHGVSHTTGNYAPSQAVVPSVASAGNSNTEYDQDLADQITILDSLIKAGRTEEALLRWLQSGREQVIFEKFMSKFSPQTILAGMAGLILLTVATTISQSLETSTRERVAWLEVVVHTLYNEFDSLVSFLSIFYFIFPAFFFSFSAIVC